jgi:hypothetical protein
MAFVYEVPSGGFGDIDATLLTGAVLLVGQQLQAPLGRMVRNGSCTSILATRALPLPAASCPGASKRRKTPHVRLLRVSAELTGRRQLDP